MGMKKSQQKKIKDVIVLPDAAPKGVVNLDTPVITETIDTVTTTFVFIAPKFGKIIYAVAVKDCDPKAMEQLIREFKRTHDYKSIENVSVEPFIRWMEEDRGYVVDVEATEFIRWE
jgi:hypothetical protein